LTWGNLATPDGFAVNAPGRPSAPELAGRFGADEPRMDLRRAEWGEAQAGFRIYRDWLAIINAHPTTQGLPVYITSTNTFAPDEGTVPAQNYVRGWLTTALEVINQEPQVQALCWFLDKDRSGDSRWDWFSPTVAAQVAAWARGEQAGGLTEREVEILQLVVAGKTNKQIARSLGLSEKAVEKYLRGIFAKVDVSSRAAAAAWAVRAGLG